MGACIRALRSAYATLYDAFFLGITNGDPRVRVELQYIAGYILCIRDNNVTAVQYDDAACSDDARMVAELLWSSN
jgi:hypothetical protein